jgi:hypothetical protein
MTTHNRYNQVVDGATKIQKREIAVSTRSHPTDKSNVHLEAVYQDTHQQAYQDVQPTGQKYTNRQVNSVNQDTTEAAYRERTHEVDQIVPEMDF